MRACSQFLLAWILFIAVLPSAQSQVPIIINTDQASSKIEWMEIESEHFKVLYPKDFASKAEIVLQQLEFYYPFLKRNLKQEFKKISVVLQTEVTSPNGYVALAPWRSHWYVMPFLGDRLGATEWLETLAIHEGRHMFQLASFRSGFSNFFYYLFGETGQSIAAIWSTPAWVFEGDAVVEETLLSNSGRGRMPEFLNFYRAQLAEDQLYDYDKSFLGSFKDFTPNHYPLGYVLNLELRNGSDPNIIDYAFKDSARSAWNPFAFEAAVSNLKRTSFSNFYEQAFLNLKNYLKKMDKDLKPTPYKEISPKTELYQNDYLMGAYQNEYLVFQTGLENADRFALYDPAKKTYKTLFRTNDYQGNKVTIRKGLFVYQDLTVHPRFNNQTYSDLFLYDLKNHNKKRLTFNKRLFLPELPPAANKIAALSFDSAFNSYINIYNLNGEKIDTIKLESDVVPFSLNFDNDQTISMIYRDNQANFYLAQLDLKSRTKKILFASNAGTMDSLRLHDNQYWFKANFDGQDNIYSYDLNSRKLAKKTESRFGAYYPLIDDDFLFYNNFTLKGRKIARTTLVHNLNQGKNKFYIDNVLPSTELAKKATFKKSNIEKYAPKKLDRDLINVHSWEYASSLLTPYQTLTLQSNDVLNETNITTGFLYHNGEKSMTYFLGADYQKYWPIFHLRGDIGRRTIFTNYGQDNEQVFSWNQNSINAGFTLPYQKLLNGNSLLSSLTVLKGYRYISNKSYPPDEQNGELNTDQVTFNFSFLGEKSFRDIKPRWGFELTANQEESKTIIGATPNANLKNYGAAFYMPSFWSHHHFFLTHSFQEKTIGSYDLIDQVLLSRGYQDSSFIQKKKYTANYSLPVAYTDFALGRYLYVKRIRTNLFYDYSVNNFDAHFRSYGLELIFDTNLFRNLFLQLSWGIRSSILIDDPENDYNHELFLETALATF